MPATLAQFIAPQVPWLAAAGLAAVSIPILIHLLTRLRRRPLAWGAMRFLLEAYRRHRSRLRIEHWVLLAVRCLILALLGLALSGPGLAGCADSGGGWAGSPRTVHMVLDDSLSTQAGGLDGQTRFERLRRTALQLLDAARPNDWLTIWQAARPGRPLAVAADDRAELRRTLQTMQPRFARCDLPHVLASISSDIDARGGQNRDEVFVFVLSDWAADATDLSAPPSAELVQLKKQCRLYIARPAPSVDNLQLSAAAPARFMVLTEPAGDAHISLTLQLHRFVANAEATRTTITITVTDHAGRRVGPAVERVHQWSVGQTVAPMMIEVAAEPDDSTWQNGRALLAIRCELSKGAPAAGSSAVLSGGGGDALAGDNQRWTLVELRRILRVGLIDRLDDDFVAADQSLLPRQWLSFALRPWQGSDAAGDSSIELTSIEASGGRVTAASLEPIDAAFVLRPELLDEAAWQALASFAKGGGLVLVTPPTEPTPAVWAAALLRDFGIDWQVGMEMQPVGEAPDGLALAADLPVPALLEMLAADLRALTRPIRIFRRFELNVPGPSDQIWLAADDGMPLLVAAQVLPPIAAASEESADQSLSPDVALPPAAGRLVLLAAALDPQWTNLTTKPLLVPLLHETLRSSLGESGVARKRSRPTSGDRPMIDAHWQTARFIGLGPDLPALLTNRSDNSATAPSDSPTTTELLRDSRAGGEQLIPLRRTNEGFVPVDPLDHPGIYLTHPEGKTPLAVNIDPAAGDTRALDADALLARLSAKWLDDENPAAALLDQARIVRLTWPLLWAVLALLLLETALARWFSHAATPRRATINHLRRWWNKAVGANHAGDG